MNNFIIKFAKITIMKRKNKKRKKLRWTRIIITTILTVMFIITLFSSIHLFKSKNRQVQPTKNRPEATSKEKTTKSELKGWTLKEEIGQLFMVGTPADRVDAITESVIEDYHIGNVFLTGRSSLSTAQIKQKIDTLNSKTKKAKLLVAVDQEGGQIQVLQGPGFSAIPDGLSQGQMSSDDLKKSAAIWANELKTAGINMNLAPVADLVPSVEFASQNAPIGYWNREYGYDAKTIVNSTTAFYEGMQSKGLLATAKHFPGIGRVTENTDFSTGVMDDITTESDDSVNIFQKLIKNNIPVIMTSTVIYNNLDANNIAAFSPTIVTGLLREELGFKGLIITDDLSNAAQVQNITVGNRAILAIEAGNNLICAGSPDQMAEMTDALYQKAEHNPDFKEKLEQAAQAIIDKKTSMGLVGNN